MIIFLDFEGTLCEHGPGIQRPVFGGLEVIAKLQAKGHTVILNTGRVAEDAKQLEETLNYVNDNIRTPILHPVQCNPHKRYPEPFLNREGEVNIVNEPVTIDKKTTTELVVYLDDMALRMPVKKSGFGSMNIVDWDMAEKHLIKAGIL